MKILIAPYSKVTRDGVRNPKDWLYWSPLVVELHKRGHETTHIGAYGEPLLPTSKWAMNVHKSLMPQVFSDHDFFICVDTWLQHAAHFYGKRGIVIWTVTDPRIFGYPEMLNILHRDAHLTVNQYAHMDGILAGLPPTTLPVRPQPSVKDVLTAVDYMIEDLKKADAEQSQKTGGEAILSETRDKGLTA